jgi:hypothetical protein
VDGALRCFESARTEIDAEFSHYAGSGYAFSNVSSEANRYLSSAQKELLLWHLRLGISMQRVQELMRVVEVKEPDGTISTMDRVITPRIKSAAYCPIPLCQSCQLARAKQWKPKVTCSKAVAKAEGVISSKKYET